MEFKFDKLYFSFDEHEILRLYFISEKNGEYVYFDGTRFFLRSDINMHTLHQYDLSPVITPENCTIREIRQNEMFESFVLLGGNYILHTFTQGDNYSSKGFIYTFHIYSPADSYYKEYVREEFYSSDIVPIE